MLPRHDARCAATTGPGTWSVLRGTEPNKLRRRPVTAVNAAIRWPVGSRRPRWNCSQRRSRPAHWQPVRCGSGRVAPRSVLC